MKLIARLAALLALFVIAGAALPAARPSAAAPPANPPSLNPPAAPLEVTLTNHAAGRLAGLQVQGAYAYGWIGPSLLVFDVADSAQPALVGRLLLPAEIADVAVSGGQAYLALGAAGLAVARIDDPAAPALVARLEDGTYDGVAAHGTTVYALTADALRIYDAADPAAPALLGALGLRVIDPAWARQLAVSGAYAYVPIWESGQPSGSRYLAIVNVSSPAQPVVAGYMSRYFEHMAVSGRYVYLNTATCVTNRCGPENAQYTHLYVYDVANPAAPILVSETTWPRWFHESSLIVSGSTGFLSGDILDLRNPAAPVFLPRPAGVDEIIAVDGQRGFARGAGFQIVDLTNPRQPAPAGSVALNPPSSFVAAEGRHALSISGATVTVTDLAAQPAPQVLATRTITSSPGIQDLASAGAVSYLAAIPATVIVDWRAPAAPIVATMPVSSVDALAEGGRLYLVTAAGDVAIYDIADPLAPQLLHVIGGLGAVQGIAKRGDIVYSIASGGDLRATDIADPARPAPVAALTLDSGAFSRLAVSGDYLFGSGLVYVYWPSSWQARHFIVDLAQPGAMHLVADESPGGDSRLLVADEQFAYRAKRNQIEVFDTTTSPLPTKTDSYTLTDIPRHAQLIGQRLVVAGGAGGVYEFATPGGVLSGSLGDGYRAPVAGVTLEVGGQIVASQADGTFVFPRLPSAWVTVTPRRNGLRFSPSSLRVRPGVTLAPLRFTAVPAPASVTVGTGAAALVSLDLRDRPTIIDLPAGAVPAGTTVTLSPTLAPAGGPELIAGHVFELALSDGAAFAQPVTVTVGYSAADLRAISEPAALRLARWQDGAWVDAGAGCAAGPPRHDQAQRSLQAAVCQSGRYALLGPTHRVALPRLGR